MCCAAAPLISNSNAEVLPLADEAVEAAGQADPVLLEAVPEPRLRHAHALLELQGQTVEVVEQLGVERFHVAGDDAAEQEPAEPGRRRHRQVAAAEGHPPSRRDRARVEDLELGQDHRVTLPVR